MMSEDSNSDEHLPSKDFITIPLADPHIDELETYNITFNWIRHGESCANYDQGSHNDKGTDIKPGYGIINNNFETKSMKKRFKDDTTSNLEKNKHASKNMLSSFFSAIKAINDYEPNLTYIGMNQAINLGTDFFSKPEHTNPNNIYLSSGLTRTITTALLALRYKQDAVIYVVPYINETSKGVDDKQNNAVPSIILKKKILFIKDWLEKNWIIEFDDIEIINFLIVIYENIDVNDTIMKELKDKIEYVLECRKSETCRETKKSNLQELITKLIDEMTSRFRYEHRFFKSDIQNNNLDFVMNTYNKLKSINLREFKRGPKVDFSIYEFYEKIYSKKFPWYHSPYQQNVNHFLNDVLLKRFKDLKNLKFYAFAHGNLIKDLWFESKPDTYERYQHKTEEDILNTLVVSDNLTVSKKLNKVINHDFEIIYTPIQIRSSYYNFEHYNENVCKRESIKGIINYPLGHPHEILNLRHYPPTSSVAFYYNNKERYEAMLPNQIGGYKQKYLKYKEKYLNLKKHNF
jgi:hypothetical protein